MTPLVTLTTDFGMRDPYVATMKGVLWSLCPGMQVIDLTHEITRHDIVEGALFLAGVIPFFPKGTIHVAVIDPGVGTERHPIVVSAGGHIVVCPDNGLLTLLVRDHPMQEARIISNPRFLREKISPTFHGRDVFAPAAARLACGEALEDAGDALVKIVLLDIPVPRKDAEGRVHGEIIHVDRFGNLITNIPRTAVGAAGPLDIRAGHHSFSTIHRTYSDVAIGAPLVLFGSADYLEIAVNGDSACAILGLAKGDPLTISC